MSKQPAITPTVDNLQLTPTCLVCYRDLRARLRKETSISTIQRVAAASLLAFAAPALIMVENSWQIDTGSVQGLSASEIGVYKAITPLVHAYVNAMLAAGEETLDGKLPTPTIEEAAKTFEELEAVYQKSLSYDGMARRYARTAHETDASIIECLSQFGAVAGGLGLQKEDALESYQSSPDGINALALLESTLKGDSNNWKPGAHMAAAPLLAALRAIDTAIDGHLAKLPN